MRSGQVIDERFEVDVLVATGGMGRVFRAHDRHSGQLVAVKTLTLMEGSAEDRFNREATLLAELRHPGIVRYVAHGHHEGEPYLAMEWLKGDDLSAKLRRLRQSARREADTICEMPGSLGGSVLRMQSAGHEVFPVLAMSPSGGLSVEETICLGRRLAGALAELHRRGIVHRDVKPGNVFLVDGLPEQAKLLDLGIARSTSSLLKLTGTGQLLGSPCYMSPEQAEGRARVTPAADVWALGCVLYECLTGHPPFQATHMLALLACIVSDDPKPLDLVRPDTPLELRELLDVMLAKQDGERLADAQLVLDALSKIAAFGTSTLRSVTAVETQNPASHERPALTTNESRVLSVLLAGDKSRGDDQVPLGVDEHLRLRFEQAISKYGCDVQLLADGFGSVLVTPRRAGMPKEQATKLARAALALRSIAPGLAFVLITGRAEAEGRLAMGIAVEHAACELAGEPAGGIRVDADSAAFLETRFEVTYRDHGYYLVAERYAEGVRTLMGKITPWVGRQRELNLLLDTYQECASEGEPRVLLVTAPAGIGKTRLRHEFVATLAKEDARFEMLYGQGDALSAGSPFVMIGPAVRRCAEVQDGEALDKRRAKLRARLARSMPESEARRLALFIGEMVGVFFDEREDEALRAARRDPSLLGELMRTAFVDWLRAECSENPMLVILDDLHWGDLPSVQYLDAALTSLSDSPLMVVALARPEVHTVYPALWQQHNVQELRLHRLSRRASAELVQHALGARTDAVTVSAIVDKAEGNAFYLEELIRFANEGRLGAVPENVIGMVQTRLDGLDQEARRVLRAASIFGEIFWEDGVRALIGEPFTSESVGSFNVDEWLTHLCDLELIRPRAMSRLPGQREFQFRHALVHDAAHKMLTQTDSALGHRLAGAWLLAAGEQDSLVLAEHFSRGGEAEAAIQWFHKAAEQAFDGSDLRAAVACCERAVALGASGDTLGALRALESQAAYWKSDYEEAKAFGESALELLGEGSEEWFRALGSTLVASARIGDTVAVNRFFHKALEAGCREGAEAAQLVCLCRGTFQLIFNAQFEEADAALARISEVAGDMQELDALTAAQVHHVRGVRAAHIGDVATFLRHLQAAVTSFETAGDTRNVCLERTTVAWCHAEVGDLGRARELCEASLEYCKRLGARQALTYAKVNLGYILSLCPGEIERARDSLRQAIGECQKVGNLRLEGWARAHLASVEQADSRVAEAEQEARIAGERLAASPGLQAWALAAHARSLLSLGRASAALAPARRAMSILRDLGGLLQGESLPPLVLAECLSALGRDDEAQQVVEEAMVRLQSRAKRLGRDDWRQSFLRLPDNLRTRALHQRLQSS